MRQVDGSKKRQTICPVNYHKSARMNLFFLTCKLLQFSKLISNDKNIVLDIANDNILLDHWIKKAF